MRKKTSRNKQLGQFFSDPFLVRFILTHLEHVTPQKMVLDPSCGEGIFLQEIHNKYPSIPTFGFEIDNQTLVRAINHLKCTSIDEELPATPRLFNVDALLPQDKFSQFLMEHRLPMQFDFILGNPPYFVLNLNTNHYRNLIQTPEFSLIQNSNVNIASLFLIRYARMLASEGQLFFIFPRSLLHVESFSTIRAFLQNFAITHIYDLGRAFKDVGLEQIIIGLKKIDASKSDNRIVHYALLHRDLDNNIVEKISYDLPQQFLLQANRFVIFAGQKKSEEISGNEVYHQIKSAGTFSLLDFCMDSNDLHTDPIMRGLGWQKFASPQLNEIDDYPMIPGRALFNFGRKTTLRYISNAFFQSQMDVFKVKLLSESPKILIQNLASSKIRLVAMYDNSPVRQNSLQKYHYALPLDTITVIFVKPGYAFYLLALLISDLITYYFRDFVFLRQTLTLHVDKKYLMEIPVARPSKEQLHAINELVEHLIRFVQSNASRTPVKDRAKPVWESSKNSKYHEYMDLIGRMNRLIYEIYGLTRNQIDFIRAQLLEFDQHY